MFFLSLELVFRVCVLSKRSFSLWTHKHEVHMLIRKYIYYYYLVKLIYCTNYRNVNTDNNKCTKVFEKEIPIISCSKITLISPQRNVWGHCETWYSSLDSLKRVSPILLCIRILKNMLKTLINVLDSKFVTILLWIKITCSIEYYVHTVHNIQ